MYISRGSFTRKINEIPEEDVRCQRFLPPFFDGMNFNKFIEVMERHINDKGLADEVSLHPRSGYVLVTATNCNFPGDHQELQKWVLDAAREIAEEMAMKPSPIPRQRNSRPR